MKLNKKTMTRLLNHDYRRSILDSYKKDVYKIFDYSHYVVDNQIISRDTKLENDKNSYYGFQPLNILCCMKKDGTIEKRFFEFKTVNHFLKDYDGDSALEVVQCILILWLNEDKKNIDSFDYEKIDVELSKLEKQYTESKKEEKEEKDENRSENNI